MSKDKYVQFVVISALLATHAWAGPGSTTNDLMSQLQTTQGGAASGVVPVPGGAQESCPAAQTIDTANQDAENNGLPFSKPWVAFNKPELLREPFNLKKTLNTIINSSPNNTVSPADLMSSIIDSHSLTSAINPASNLVTPLDVRDLESQINPQAAVDEWFPVGVFNRLDTAPRDGSHCGEYRIVYANPGSNAIDPSLQAGPARFFTIFEAAIPNPQPDKGIQGCLPIGEFWASLADPSLNDEERVVLLEKFFYQGIDVESSEGTVSFEPAVSFSHYQSPLGQVRTNEFFTSKWQLREFKTAGDESGKPVFSVETVKNNALTEFYNLESEFPSENSTQFGEIASEFQDAFISEQMHQLTSADGEVQDGKALVNRISMVVPNKFNEFQSDSQGSADDIAGKTGEELKTRIGIELNSINTIATNITQNHVLARAEAMSCGGCHQISNDKVIADLSDGTEVRWPRSAGFVHIDEQGSLSPALEDTFLPAREEVLKNFVCANKPSDRCAKQTEALTEESTVVEASGSLNSFFSPWKAFDDTDSSLWVSTPNETPAWISYSWDTPRVIGKYSITNANWESISFGPKDWEVQGWDGQNWETVDTRSNETNWGSGETRTYTVASSSSYTKYRILFSDDNIIAKGIQIIAIDEISFESCNE